MALTDGTEKVKTIGLTGGIGTGKTEVSRILRDLGAEVISADDVAHETYEPNTRGWTEIVHEFGPGVLTAGGAIDRAKLGSVVFADRARLDRLNAIVHPRTRELVEERVRRLGAAGRQTVVVEVPLLVEAMAQDGKWASLIDEVWVTTSAEDLVVERLMGRGGLDEAAIRARVGSQVPQSERLAYADVVIENTGSLGELRERVVAAWNERASKG